MEHAEFPKMLYRGSEAVVVNGLAEQEQATSRGFGEKLETDSAGLKVILFSDLAGDAEKTDAVQNEEGQGAEEVKPKRGRKSKTDADGE